MSFIQWEDRYGTQIELMDEHHQKLIALINRLYSGVFECKEIEEERELTRIVLSEIENYVDYHFTAEEQLMNKYHYPEYTEHMAEHDLFRREIARLSEQFDAGGFALSFSVFEFLRDWLVNHILVKDMMYSPWLAERGVK